MQKHLSFIIFLLFYSLLWTWVPALAQVDDVSATEANRRVEDLVAKAHKNVRFDTSKSLGYLNEALKYKNQIGKKPLLKIYKALALAYSYQQSYIIALDYYYKSLELQKKLEPSKMHFTYNNIGSQYLELGDTVKALKFWNLSLKGLKEAIKNDSIEKKSLESYVVYGNLAGLEMEKGNYPTAFVMLSEYKKHSVQLKDTFGIILSCQNLATYYQKVNRADSSRFYLNKAIYLSKKINSTTDLAFLYYDAGFEYSNNKNDSAGYYLHNAFNLASQSHLNDVKLSAARALADLYDQKNDYKKSNEYLRIANSLSEEDISKQSKRKVEMLEFEYEQKMKQQLVLVQAKRRESIFVFSLILLVPVSVIGFLMYTLQRTKAKKRKAENELLIQKLEIKNKELTSNAIQMFQTNEIIDSTHKELKQLKGMADAPTNNVLNLIISDLKKGNHSFNKKEFEKVFIETDEVFYKKLLKEFPTLTNNEIRLCAFAKLGFSTKEISDITQQSANSILVARSRLRKKIGLDEHKSLTTFLKGF